MTRGGTQCDDEEEDDPEELDDDVDDNVELREGRVDGGGNGGPTLPARNTEVPRCVAAGAAGVTGSVAGFSISSVYGGGGTSTSPSWPSKALDHSA